MAGGPLRERHAVDLHLLHARRLQDLLLRGIRIAAYSEPAAVASRRNRPPASPAAARGAASGHAATAPPSAASNSHRPMVTVIRPSRARCVEGTIPRHERAVFTSKDDRMLVASIAPITDGLAHLLAEISPAEIGPEFDPHRQMVRNLVCPPCLVCDLALCRSVELNIFQLVRKHVLKTSSMPALESSSLSSRSGAINAI